MKIKREVSLNGAGIIMTSRMVCRFNQPLAEPVKVLHVLPSGYRWHGFTTRPSTAAGGPDAWETAGFAALWVCGLVSIGLCLI